MKILVSDKLADEGIKILKAQKRIKVDFNFTITPEELISVIGGYEALIIRSRTKVDKKVIDAARKLKIIARAGVGVDNIDLPAASKRGIIVMNTPGGNTISTAEQAMALILALSRNTTQADASIKKGHWDKKKFTGVELYGKTLGLIGLGRVGTEVARRAKSFGMKIIAYDPFIAKEKADDLSVALMGRDEVIRKADYLTVHSPLTDDTYHLLGEGEFRKMKKGVRVINCARGGIIDEKALYQAIKKGTVAGAALDVFEIEPPKKNPLLKLDCVITTPHLGASTREAQANVAVDAACQVIDALRGKAVRNALNLPSVEPELLARLTPFISLGENLGKLQAQLAEGGFKEIRIEYKGINYDTQAITVAIIKGILTPVLEETVNFVNAPLLAQERKIKITESKTSTVEDFANLIQVTLITGKGRSLVEGTVFGMKNPRLVRINSFPMDAVASGNLLLLKNRDVPGVIGKVGTLLGKHRVNIASFQLGRAKRGGIALAILNLDNPPDDKTLKELGKIKEIFGVKLVRI